jgi:hypothetical protein
MSLQREDARELAEQCLRGEKFQRLGAAQVYSASLRAAAYWQSCSIALVQLFNDLDNDVRREAASCFRNVDGGELARAGDLIESFVMSPAFSTDSFSLIHSLEETPVRLPEATLLACGRFVDTVGVKSGDIQSAAAMEASSLGKLLLRVYSQSEDEAFRSRCLDVVDRMVDVGAFGFGEALATLERDG